MPPKGWRKNAEGQYPQQNKDQDFTSIDDILFPRATVQKLAKQILNVEIGDENTNSIMAKDSVIALQRSATVFVSHLLFHARQISKDDFRKTVIAQDILLAIEKADFPGFVPEVKQKLASFEQKIEVKKMYKKVLEQKKEAADGSEEEQAPKRGKGNDSDVIIKSADASQIEEDAEEVEEDEGDNKEDEDEDDDDDEDEDDEEEDEDEAVRTKNPISLLEREERELTQDVDNGSGAEDDDEEEGDDEDD